MYVMIADLVLCIFFFFKQKTAYEMRISDWSSDVCSSDLNLAHAFAACGPTDKGRLRADATPNLGIVDAYNDMLSAHQPFETYPALIREAARALGATAQVAGGVRLMRRSEEHTSELQSLMRISYAVFCLKKKKQSHH